MFKIFLFSLFLYLKLFSIAGRNADSCDFYGRQMDNLYLQP